MEFRVSVTQSFTPEAIIRQIWPQNETRREVCKSEVRVYGGVREGLPARRVYNVSYEDGACREGGARVCKGYSRAKGQTKQNKNKNKNKKNMWNQKITTREQTQMKLGNVSCSNDAGAPLCMTRRCFLRGVCKWTRALSDGWVANSCRHSRSTASQLSTERRISMCWCKLVLSGKSTTWSWRLRSLSSGSRCAWTGWWRWPSLRAWRSPDGQWTAAWTDLRSVQSTPSGNLVRWPLP